MSLNKRVTAINSNKSIKSKCTSGEFLQKEAVNENQAVKLVGTRMRLADYVAHFLAEHGIDVAFVLTGNGAMYLNDGIVSEPRIQYFCARNEAAAPMMAEAYARVKGKPAVVCVTSGPGSTNAVPGLAEAFVDSAPVIILSGQVPLKHTSRHAGIKGLRSLGNAEIDIISIVEPLTKYACMVEEPTSIRYHLEKALYMAVSGRPGPVWLDIPMDIQSAEIQVDELTGFEISEHSGATDNIEAQVDAMVDALCQSARPLLIAGHGVRQAQAIEEFAELNQLLNLPFFVSRLSKDILPHSNELHMGLAGVKGERYCRAIMCQADFVLSLGCRLAVQFVGHSEKPFADNAKVAMVDIDEAELSRPELNLEFSFHCDVKQFLQLLITRLKLKGTHHDKWLQWVDECKALRKNNPMVLPEYARNPIDIYYFISRLDLMAKSHHIFTSDTGSNYYVCGQVLSFNKAKREVTSGTFCSMGLSIPLAIGAAIADPDAQILAIVGDGSLELNVQELKTISYYQLNIKLFVINNGGYLSMRRWQDDYFEGRRIGSDINSGVDTLNLPHVARAFDLDYACIDDYATIDDRLEVIMSDNRPLFVEVICDSQQSIIEPMVDGSF